MSFATAAEHGELAAMHRHASFSTSSPLQRSAPATNNFYQPTSACTSRKVLKVTGLALTSVLLVLLFTLGVVRHPPLARPPFQLEHFLSGRFSANGFNGSWVSDSQFMYRDAGGSVMLYDVFAGTSEALVSPAEAPLLTESFLQQLSADRKFLLLGYAYEKLYRKSFLANYSIVNIETKTSTELVAPDESRRLQLVKWAPVGNALVLVRQNNIYYKPSAEQVNMHVITSSGRRHAIYNGVPDWVYEVAVFRSNCALWFSPSGRFLAYATFDDSGVHNVSFPWYGEPRNNFAHQYPGNVTAKYPKPGTPNPTVKLHIIDLKKTTEGNGKSVMVPPPTEVGADHILAAVTWSRNDEVTAVWMNRTQDMLVVIAQSAENATIRLKLLQHAEAAGWVDMFTAPEFSADGNRMLLIMPQPQEGGVGEFRHLTLVTRGAAPVPLTKGQFVVTSIAAWDHASATVYFLATSAKDPAQQNMYSTMDDGSTPEAQCLSCGVKVTATRTACTHVSASFSTASSYYVLSCNGPDVPGAIIFKKGGAKVRVWEENARTVAWMAAHSAPTRQRLFVDVPGGMRAYAQLWLPPGMDESGKTKYPMLVYVFGKPGTARVSDRWSGDWGTYLTTNRSIIYAAIDGRGSGLKGNNILFSGYRRLGSVEIEDQINVTKYLQNTFPYIDKERTAIWGWSIGGYSAAMALAKDSSGVFRCGMAVAPPTDWTQCYSFYTERYMRLPGDNQEGYRLANLSTQVDNLGRNEDRFLLLHGTGDFYIHYTHAMMLARVLQKNKILFSFLSYPDEDHLLINVLPHVYRTMEKFLDVCLHLPATELNYLI